MLSLIIAGTDLAIKQRVEKHIPLHKDTKILGETCILRKVHNEGMMLNLAEKHARVVRIVSLIVTAIIACVHLGLYGKSEYTVERIGTSLLLGGALSNTFDRIVRGYVVDYLAFQSKNKKIKRVTYNIGDFAIFAGGILISICALIRGK